jgi:hypothetical protein
MILGLLFALAGEFPPEYEYRYDPLTAAVVRSPVFTIPTTVVVDGLTVAAIVRCQLKAGLARCQLWIEDEVLDAWQMLWVGDRFVPLKEF